MSSSSSLPFRLSLLWAFGSLSCGQATAVIEGTVSTGSKLERLQPQEAYRETVHALLRTQVCIGCHRKGGLGPEPFADEQVAVAFDAALRMPLFNTTKIEESKIIRKLSSTAIHNCGDRTQCDALIEKLQNEVKAFSQATLKDDFQITRLETAAVVWSKVPLQLGNADTPTKKLVFSLVPPLPKKDVIPRFELTLRRVTQFEGKTEEVWSFTAPRLHIEAPANVRVKNVTVLRNGVSAANTLQTIDALVVGPTPPLPEPLMRQESAGGALTLNPDDSVQLAFEILEFAK